MSSITDLVAEFVAVRSQRMALEKQAEDLKNGKELELKQTILQVMSSQGLKSANVEGLGRVVSKETTHFEIQNIEALCYVMFKNMVEAAQQNRPLSDALLLQRRVHKENLENFTNDTAAAVPNPENFLASLGVKKVVKTDLSFTRS